MRKLAVLVLCRVPSLPFFASEAPVDISKPWSVGVSVTYPLGANIWEIQFSYGLWDYGEILIGGAYQNWTNELGTAHGSTLLLGYRQYLWNGFHVEAEFWPAWNPFDSSVDGKTYSGFDLWCSFRAGYRLDVPVAGQDFFVLIQPSLGFGLARQNPWPGMPPSPSAPMFEPQLITGWKLP